MRSSRMLRPRTKHLLAAILAALVLGPLPAACGHGGAFRGPNGAVPPGLRVPSDPEPPPPPPTEPGDPAPPITPGEGGSPPVTPPDGGHDTTPDAGPPPPMPSQGGGGSRKTASITYDSWRFWWAYNNDDILNLRRLDLDARTDASPLAAGMGARENRRNALRPTQFEILRIVLPALERCIDRRDEHEDVHGGAIIAAAKLGSGRLLPVFDQIIWNRRTNARGERLDYGPQARESGVLALGLLPELDGAGLDAARRILLDAIADESLRTRERTWAAVSLGLRRDAAAVRPLLDLLSRRYADDNVPAGIVVGLGLIGSREALPALEEIFVKGQYGGRDVSQRVRPFAGYALGKLGDPAAMPAVLKVLGSRRAGALTTRSAAVAAGALAEHADDTTREQAANALLKMLRGSGSDISTRNFTLIALGRVGTAPALLALLEEAENGPYTSRAFAALGVSTCVFYADRAAAEGRGAPMDAALRRRIVDKLAQVGARLKDTELRSAFLLARGLVKDATALDELVAVVTRPGDQMLRGTACVALGLLGDTREQVKDALRRALAERANVDVRRDAATGLGLLHDAGTVPQLLEELRTASSFAVQGQIVTAIGTIGDERALAPLVTLLEDRTQAPSVRALAAVGLGLIGDSRLLPPLARLSRDYNYRASVPDLDELLYIF